MTGNHFKIKKEGEHTYIFDIVRKKYVLLTPEEKVRQQVLLFFITELNYPKGMIAVEKELKFNQLAKRPDIVVYKESKPWLIVECKAPNVPVDDKTCKQIATYNLTLQVPYLYLTNGKVHYVSQVNWDDRTIKNLSELPNYG